MHLCTRALLTSVFTLVFIHAFAHDLPPLRNAAYVCISPEARVIRVSKKAHCPCHVRTYVSVLKKQPEISATLYTMPESAYAIWDLESSGIKHLPPSPPGALSPLNATLDVFERTLRTFGWAPPTLEVPASDNYVAVLALKSRARLTVCAYITVTVEPTVCTGMAIKAAKAGASRTPQGHMRVAAGYTAELDGVHKTCTATLVAPQWALTATSCMVSPGDALHVGTRAAKNGERLLVSTVHAHRAGSLTLLRLSTPSRHAQPLAIAFSHPRIPARAENVGAALRTSSFSVTHQLLLADARSLPPSRCREELTKAGNARAARVLDPRTALCIWRDPQCVQQSVCEGAPVVARARRSTVLVGFAVTTNQTEESHSAPWCAVITGVQQLARVAPYVPWIRAVTNESVKVVAWPPMRLGSGLAPVQKRQKFRFPVRSVLSVIAAAVFLVLVAVLRKCALVRSTTKVVPQPLASPRLQPINTVCGQRYPSIPTATVK